MGREVKFSLDWLKPPPAPVDGSMTLFEHLRELRYRLVVAGVAIVAGMIVAGIYHKHLEEFLKYPYYAGVATLKADDPDVVTRLINTDVTAPIALWFKVTALGGVLLSAPIWLYQVWSFVVPALHSKEKKWSVLFIAAGTPLFLVGVGVGYWVMPKGIAVLMSFTSFGVENMVNINNFLSFLIRMMLIFGVAFLIPLIVLMLNMLGVIKATHLSKYRIYIVFLTFVFGAIATPSTDPFSMLALALPMSLLFIATEVLAHIFDRRKERKAARGGTDLLVGHSVEDDKTLAALADDEPGSNTDPETGDTAK